MQPSTRRKQGAVPAVGRGSLSHLAQPPDLAHLELPSSSFVVLGMLGLGVRSGYEIKRAVDESIRQFAAISFRQIYPDLKRMEDLGLVVATEAPIGNKRRTYYELTAEGAAALEWWLRSDEPITTELRHTGLLKLFFSDRLTDEERLALVARVRSHHIQTRNALASSRPAADARTRLRGEVMPLLTLDFGLELSDFVIGWCDRLERELRRSDDAP